MNSSKTEIILYGTRLQLSKVKIDEINVGGVNVKCVDSVRDPRVWMENTLSFDRHVAKKSQTANHQLQNLKGIRNNLSQKSVEALVHGLVHSHLGFCNGLFAEMPDYQIYRLQKNTESCCKKSDWS